MKNERSSIKILFIEDLESDYELAKRTLKRENLSFISIRVDTEKELIDAFSSFNPDIIISDYSMPRFDGMKALQLTLKLRQDIPFIVLTGSMNEETAVKCMKAGATDYVIKERIKRLPFAVNEALDRARFQSAAKKAERDLILSEERFRKLAENAQDLIFRFEILPKPRFVYVSPSATRLTGYTPNDFYGHPNLAYQIVLDQDKVILRNLRDESFDTDKPVSLRITRKDGGIIWVELVGVLIYNNKGDLSAFEGVIRDINERKLAEEALIENEKKYRILFEDNPNSMWVYEPDSLKIIDVNKVAVKTYGYSKNEFLNLTIKDIRPESQIDDLMKNISESNSTIQRSGPWLHKYKDGTLVYVEIVSHTIDYEGKLARLVVAHDITEQIISTRALSEQRQLAQATLDSINANICVLSESGKVLAVNKSWIDFGIQNNANVDKIGVSSNYFDVCELATGSDKESATLMKNGILSVLEGKSKKFELEYECHSPSIERWFVARVTPFESDKSEINRVVVAHEDITHRKLSEDLVRESEERYSTFMNSTTDVAYIKDENLRYVMINKAGIETLKKPLNQIIGKTDFELLKFDYAHSYSLSDKEAIEKGRLVTKTETIGEKIFETRKFPVRLGKGRVGVGCFIRDVTERYHAQKAIQASEQKYRNLVENSLVGVYSSNVNGEFLFANAALCNILEYNSVKELLGANVKSIYPNLAKREDFIKKLRLNDKLLDYEIDLLTKNGNVRTVTLSAIISGDIISGMIMDITDKKKSEQEIIQKNQEIEAQNEEYRILNEELTEARIKAEESDRLKTAFLQNLSHEIRTPMNGIIGFTQLLKEGLDNKESREQYLEMIDKSGERLMNIINDLVEISKIETGHISIFNSEFRVNELLYELNTHYIRLANEKGLKLILSEEHADKSILLFSDKGKISQVISNLVNNAIKFTEEGSVEFGYSLSDEFLEFFVKDSGIGMSPELHAVIFHRFRQADTSLSRGYEGAGLGLSISKAFIEKLGGNIWVESELGKGSIFKFTIPRNQILSITSKELNMEKSINSSSSNKKVLVVEDDVVSRMLLNEILKSSEMEVVFARNGVEALEIVKANADSIDFILMDLKMPLMNGYDATLKIRELGFTKPIIAQTAYASKDDEKRVMANGFDAYISKPVQKNKLLHVLSEIESKK